MPEYFPQHGLWFSLADVQHHKNVGAHIKIDGEQAKKDLAQLEAQINKEKKAVLWLLKFIVALKKASLYLWFRRHSVLQKDLNLPFCPASFFGESSSADGFFPLQFSLLLQLDGSLRGLGNKKLTDALDCSSIDVFYILTHAFFHLRVLDRGDCSVWYVSRCSFRVNLIH